MREVTTEDGATVLDQTPHPADHQWNHPAHGTVEIREDTEHPDHHGPVYVSREFPEDVKVPPFITGSVYLLGPMTGYPNFNVDAFRNAASALRSAGWDVVSPVEMDDEEGFVHASRPDGFVTDEEHADFLRRDLARIASDFTIQAAVALPGWEKSKGAAKEVDLFRMMEKTVYAYPTMEPIKRPSDWRPTTDENTAEEALRLVGGTRRADYGHPIEDFTRVSEAAKALGLRPDLHPEHHALYMILVKLSRLMENPSKRDSVVDITGYALTYEMVRDHQGEPLR